MEKEKRIKWITLLLVIGILIIGGGIIMHHEEKVKQHEELVSLVKEETPKIKRYVHKQDERHAIKTITIEYQETHVTPMDFIEIEGYVNGNKKLGFEVDADTETEGERLHIGGFSCSTKMGKLIGF
ncbi:DUF1433 domain-containing protein [Ligilactobacillus sp. LYQ112]|uniref:DUF1433 domain-containing protein n=1 Tax=unclassified Ligilactobacillus TaxID=2767920 RepID=UPI0038554389